MTVTTAEIAAPVDVVFAVVTDPRTYPEWLVGARSIRSTDASWPAVGSSFRHVIGFAPLVLAGSSTVRELSRPHRFELGAGMGPLGEATVRFTLSACGDGGATRLQIDEEFTAGPVGWLWKLLRPVMGALVWGRNAVSLESLTRLVEDASHGAGASDRDR
jgi:uncharacterized protein YndB with AHSA1/START domain